jgi:hypothetical protein
MGLSTSSHESLADAELQMELHAVESGEQGLHESFPVARCRANDNPAFEENEMRTNRRASITGREKGLRGSGAARVVHLGDLEAHQVMQFIEGLGSIY